MEKKMYLDIFKGGQAVEIDRRHSEPLHHYRYASTDVDMVKVCAGDDANPEFIPWNLRQVSVRFKEPR